jgi:hypothetical protein
LPHLAQIHPHRITLDFALILLYFILIQGLDVEISCALVTVSGRISFMS